jgi:hypothetical protein
MAKAACPANDEMPDTSAACGRGRWRVEYFVFEKCDRASRHPGYHARLCPALAPSVSSEPSDK